MQEHSAGSALLGLRLAGGYAAVLAVLILVGVPVSFIGDYPGNAVRAPIFSVLIAALLGASAFGLKRQRNWARLLFLVIAPWGSLALASGFAIALWRNDIPWTQLFWVLYAPLAYLLTRKSILSAMGVSNTNWIGRGAALLLGCAAVMLLARWGVMASKPSGGGFYGQLVSMNEYVQRLVITIVPFWHYVAGCIAALIPFGGLAAIGRRA